MMENGVEQITEELPEFDEPKKRGRLQEIISFLVYAAVIFGCTFLIIVFVAQRTSVSGTSMNDTLQD